MPLKSISLYCLSAFIIQIIYDYLLVLLLLPIIMLLVIFHMFFVVVVVVVVVCLFFRSHFITVATTNRMVRDIINVFPLIKGNK